MFSRDDAVFVSLSCSIHAAAVSAEGWLLLAGSRFQRRKRRTSNEVAVVGCLLHSQAAPTSQPTVCQPVVGNVGEADATVCASRG